MCDNKVSYWVPRGYGHKEVLTRCGGTDVYGQTAICEQCEKDLSMSYPQGWRNTPGDLCPHGNYVGDAGGADYMCGECEGE